MKKLPVKSPVYIIFMTVLFIASAYINIIQYKEIRFWRGNTISNFFEGYGDIMLVYKSNFNNKNFRLSIGNQGVGIITQTVPGLRYMGIKGSSTLSEDLLIAINNPPYTKGEMFLSYFYRNFKSISLEPPNHISISEFQKAINNTIDKAPKN
ncbi:hypothetical protein [Alicyclobacillus tolerans]|uniref:Uncharacterized protein n=2 Tax=Alicyclobacillus tolerans TaxID=90970 RepID=A0ABT9LYY7_9BACL|nr:hypothetical protein [Alicyclobacillus tengchongensis]MDP9729492.1 hypothetical protein [Alicyclobacillus tengchongensis]